MARHDDVRGHILTDDRPDAHDGVVPDGDVLGDHRSVSEPHVRTDADGTALYYRAAGPAIALGAVKVGRDHLAVTDHASIPDGHVVDCIHIEPVDAALGTHADGDH